MKFLKMLFFILYGLVFVPIHWVLRLVGLASPLPTFPQEFQALAAHFQNNGVWSGLTMQAEEIPDVEHWGLFKFGLDPNVFQVAAVMLCHSEEAARSVEKETSAAPQYTNVRRNRQLVIACTFRPPNPSLAENVESAFVSFDSAQKVGQDGLPGSSAR